MKPSKGQSSEQTDQGTAPEEMDARDVLQDPDRAGLCPRVIPDLVRERVVQVADDEQDRDDRREDQAETRELSAAAEVRAETLSEVSWSQGVNLDDYAAEALSIAQDGGADERETWVAQVIDAAGEALARPIRTSSQLGVGPMVNRALRERALATSLAASVADLLDPGHLISG